MTKQEVFSNGDKPASPKSIGYLKSLYKKLGLNDTVPEGVTQGVVSGLIEPLVAKVEEQNNKPAEVQQSFEGVKVEKPAVITNGDTPAVKIGMIEKLVLKHFSARNEALPTAQAFIKTCNYMLALCNAWEESLK